MMLMSSEIPMSIPKPPPSGVRYSPEGQEGMEDRDGRCADEGGYGFYDSG